MYLECFPYFILSNFISNFPNNFCIGISELDNLVKSISGQIKLSLNDISTSCIPNSFSIVSKHSASIIAFSIDLT